MPKRNQFDQFDDAVQALLGTHASQPKVNARQATLLRIAEDLRDLPREEFRARLKADLRRRTMATPSPELRAGEQHTATPYLSYKNASAAIEFYKTAFGAQERMRLTEPSGKIGHAEIAIGDSLLRLADEYPEFGVVSAETLGGSPVKIKLLVADADLLAKQAVAAGAKVLRPVEDQFYGERAGQVVDPFGYTWIISTPKEMVSAEEMQRRLDKLSKPAPPKTGVRPVPEGYRTVTPYLVGKNAPALLEFVKRTFGAKENFRSVGSAGGMHADVTVGDSHLMIGGGGPEHTYQGDAKLGAFHVYVRDCDATYERALEAGGTSLDEPRDQSYGERSATVKDTEGNFWYIATYQGNDYKWEGAPDVQPSLHPLRGEPVIQFLKRAFGAVEVGRHATPDGVIHHASMKIGDSYMELGEAHGPYQPMHSMFYLYLPDVDAAYHRALTAGGTSLSAPTDQPYGDRNATVRDPFGNEWCLATPLKDAAV